MTSLRPHNPWWPNRPQAAIYVLFLCQAVTIAVACVSFAGMLSGLPPLICIPVMAGCFICWALAGGIRWVLEMLIWEVERIEAQNARPVDPSPALHVEHEVSRS